MKEVKQMEITGRVIKGQGYGRVLGFPTANLDRRQYVRNKMNVKFGIWAGFVFLETVNKKQTALPAAIVIGPIDKTGLPKLEAHIIDFKGNLYGKKITINLKKYVREFRKYASQEILEKQIKKDIQQIKKILFLWK